MLRQATAATPSLPLTAKGLTMVELGLFRDKQIETTDDDRRRQTTSISYQLTENESMNDAKKYENPTESTFLDDSSSFISSCEDIVMYPSDEEGSSLSDSDSSDVDDDESCLRNSEYPERLKYNSQDFVHKKQIPSPSGVYKVVCLSFLEPNINTSVATQVFEEAYRMLQPNGLLYVVDKCTVAKNPRLRQFLTRVVEPTTKQKLHDVNIQLLLESNGFETSGSGDIVRWMGIKR